MTYYKKQNIFHQIVFKIMHSIVFAKLGERKTILGEKKKKLDIILNIIKQILKVTKGSRWLLAAD